MKIRLTDIASIQTGLFTNPVPDGEIVYLQAKNFDETGHLINVLYPDLKKNKSIEKHLLREGDILFAGKGTKNFAAMYQGAYPAVASTSFFVIRIDRNFRDQILPDFLVWHLNHPGTMNFLKTNAIGSSIASISKIVLEHLELSVPDLLTQKRILEVARLRKKEKELKQQIEKLEENHIQQQLINALKNFKK